MTVRSTPTRSLPDRPNLDQLKRQAKELLDAFRNGDAAVAKEVHAHYRQADPSTFRLHDAQLVLARAYGFDSWPKFKAFVDGVTVRRLVDAIQADDLESVKSMVAARPELVHLDLAENDEHQALHHAVLHHRPAIVRFLMQQGANARKGIYPHRGASTAYTLAAERGDEEIVRIIEDEERKRPGPASLHTVETRTAGGLMEAFERGDEATLIAVLDANSTLIGMTDPRGRTALHWAAACLWPNLVSWLLDHGADPSARAKDGATPLDLLGYHVYITSPAEHTTARSIALLLTQRGATQTARGAIAAGDARWLEARHREGLITNGSGLLDFAVAVNQPDILKVLLELGLDPDESGRVEGLEETVPTWGGPLRLCAIAGSVAMAEILLAHGANPNTMVYAASSALYEAQKGRNAEMIALLERHGGRLAPTAAAGLGLVDEAAKLLAEAQASRDPASRAKVVWDLLWGAIESPSPEIVALALPAAEWPRDDSHWHGILENALYLKPESDRRRHLEAFRLVLERCDPDVHGHWNTTLLHDIAASRGDLTADDRIAYATLVLDRGARLDVRDDLLKSTPLGWAARWGRIEMVKLLLERGADPHEATAEPWATPIAWARKRGHKNIVALLESCT